jgi:hypothetical protein
MHAAGGVEDAEKLRLLRACLAGFEGQHAFHNFTQRRLYRLSRREGWRQRERKLAARAAKRMNPEYLCIYPTVKSSLFARVNSRAAVHVK